MRGNPKVFLSAPPTGDSQSRKQTRPGGFPSAALGGGQTQSQSRCLFTATLSALNCSLGAFGGE